MRPDRLQVLEPAAGVDNHAGLQPITIGYANETQVSPGVQLFSLASTLFSLGMYTAVGQPNGHAAAWKEYIIS